MEYLLLFIILGTLISSFLCSLSEAALYSVPGSYVKVLEESGSAAGRRLNELKENMERPIAAILILNTLANTLGPTLAGSIADDIWGPRGVFAVAALLTVAILLFGEIVPKVLGVTYCKTVASYIAAPLSLLLSLFAPIVWVTTHLSSSLKPTESGPTMSHEEVKSFAELGTEEGALDEFEGEVIQNVIELDEIIVRDILTPRVVVFRLRDNLTVGEVERELPDWSHSRVPLYPADDPEHLTGYVLQRDVFRELMKGNRSITLKQICRQLPVVPELIRADRLLLRMVDKREHICAVVDEHGSLAGIVTLEDALEQLIGKEIVDEYDAVADLRTFAGLLKVARHRRKANEKMPVSSGSGSGDYTAASPDARQRQLEKVLQEARKLKSTLNEPPNTGS
jgi:CBS domain containing-hemolysin-like protein